MKKEQANTTSNTERVKLLQLTVINSGPMAVGTTFIITPDGLSNSVRDNCDNNVYFGCGRSSNSIINDIELPPQDKMDASDNYGRHFMIYY